MGLQSCCLGDCRAVIAVYFQGEALLSKGRIKPAGAGPETGEERTKSVTNVKKRLDAMLKAIESDLHEADKSLEGKLKALTETSVSAKLQASLELHVRLSR
jgi:hypothetical protein